MARKRKYRMSGISVNEAEKVCASHYKGNQVKVDVCKATARSLIKKMVTNKHKICSSWCGCK
jgi:hypothetical protein